MKSQVLVSFNILRWWSKDIYLGYQSIIITGIGRHSNFQSGYTGAAGCGWVPHLSEAGSWPWRYTTWHLQPPGCRWRCQAGSTRGRRPTEGGACWWTLVTSHCAPPAPPEWAAHLGLWNRVYPKHMSVRTHTCVTGAVCVCEWGDAEGWNPFETALTHQFLIWRVSTPSISSFIGYIINYIILLLILL